MKVSVDIPDSKIDEAAKAELKSLRTKNSSLVAQNEKLKRDLREHAEFLRQYHAVRGTIIDLAETMNVGVDDEYWS